MVEFAERLCRERHFEAVEIRGRQRAVLKRRSKVKEAAVERRAKLEDCRKLMVFIQNVMEVIPIWSNSVLLTTEQVLPIIKYYNDIQNSLGGMNQICTPELPYTICFPPSCT